MSQTTLVARMSSWASAIARTSACVISPRLGSDWANASSGLPNRRWRSARLGAVGPVRLANQDHHAERVKIHPRYVGKCGLSDAPIEFQVFADVRPKVIDAAFQETRTASRAGVHSSLENSPDLSAVLIRSMTASIGRPVRFVRYASSQLSF